MGIVGAGLAQDRTAQRNVHKGHIVRVNPDKNTVVIRAGTGAQAKEMEYKVATSTKYWGTDKRPFTTGLRYQGFREGTEVWFVPGTGDQALAISELWFYDPGQQPMEEEVVYQEGKIVRVDPGANIIVVRTGTGKDIIEHEYRVDTTTRYWGTDQQPFTTGLRYQGFREGTPIWFRVGPGERNRSMSEIRFHNPSVRPGVRPGKP